MFFYYHLHLFFSRLQASTRRCDWEFMISCLFHRSSWSADVQSHLPIITLQRFCIIMEKWSLLENNNNNILMTMCHDWDNIRNSKHEWGLWKVEMSTWSEERMVGKNECTDHWHLWRTDNDSKSKIRRWRQVMATLSSCGPWVRFLIFMFINFRLTVHKRCSTRDTFSLLNMS